MNKKIFYILGSLCLLGLIVLVFFKQQEKKLDVRVSLNKKYKAPYGLYVAYNMLPSLFSNSTIVTNDKAPIDWYDSDSCRDGKTLFIAISSRFNPNRDELAKLFHFVKQGNHVFISTPYMSDAAKEYFGFGEEVGYTLNPSIDYYKDSATTSLSNPPFGKETSYFNPGFSYTTHFTGLDSERHHVLGKDEAGYPNFITVKAGKGSFYFHSDPLLFDNYFLLHQDNIAYFQKALSLIPDNKSKIIWDEYFFYKYYSDYNDDNDRSRSEPSPLRILLNYPAFQWAFFLLLLLLALYVATHAKRMQRLINIVTKPKNDTLDFTKTVGRLYFEKSDHTNLAKKMATYLMEHIRNRFLISTASLNEDFIQKLSAKSGYEEEKVKEITGHLVFIQSGHNVNQEQLIAIYQSFSKFYKYTS